MLDFERRGYINYIEDRQLEILLAISELSPKNIIENSQTPKSYPKQTRQQTTQKRSQLSDFENRRILPQIEFDLLNNFPRKPSWSKHPRRKCTDQRQQILTGAILAPANTPGDI